jgi:hypothetical protein
MIRESYPLISSNDQTIFNFTSIGSKGNIQKIITFSVIGDNLWNLGFGDASKTGWSDSAISNNGDIFKVMETIAQAAIIFTASFPERQLIINPVDSKRKALYNTIFKRKHQEILELFKITGILNNNLKNYDPNVNFDMFLIARKERTFVSN